MRSTVMSIEFDGEETVRVPVGDFFGIGWHQLNDFKTGVNGRSVPQDVAFARLKGRGKYVGDALALFNTVDSWWGEGDEKIHVDGNLGIGRTVNNRYRSLDAIPFNESIDYTIELFEWQESRITYAPTSFYHMMPGGECLIGHDDMTLRACR